jgi:hypothetical protein
MKTKYSLLVAGTALGMNIALPAAPVLAQASMTTDHLINTMDQRTRAETARLYAQNMEDITQAIIESIASDGAGISVINSLRAGSLAGITNLDTDQQSLATALGIQARVVNVSTTADVDERIVVYVAESALRNSVTRADIEREAAKNSNMLVARIQDGELRMTEGGVDISMAARRANLPNTGVATYIGIRGADLATSAGAGTTQVRTLQCAPGEYGAGIVQERSVGRDTQLGGSTSETFGAWVEVSRSCAPEYSESIRFFDNCVTTDGTPGRAVYEATQYIRKDPASPFETIVEIDRSTSAMVDASQCISGDRLTSNQDFLVEGNVHALNELFLRFSAFSGNIGNGPNNVPYEVNAGGTGPRVPVTSIPFPATSRDDFEYRRSCLATYGAVPLPSGFTGPSQFSGTVEYNRDYNRRETYFADERDTYILNYEVVTDPNAFGWPSKGRGTISASADGSPVPTTNGWYHRLEDCRRPIQRPEREDRMRQCYAVHPSHPYGSLDERRLGTGFYTQYSAASPQHGAIALNRIDWNPWFQTRNDCHYVTSSTRNESRSISVSSGASVCSQSQSRTVTVTTYQYLDGRSSGSTSYGSWSNQGAPTGCIVTGGGGGGGGVNRQGFDTTGDGRIDTIRDDGTTPANAVGHGSPITGASSIDFSNPNSGNSSGGNSSGGGGGSDGGGGCFAGGTPIQMADGSFKRIEDVSLGDKLAAGGLVLVTEVYIADDIFLLDGVRVTSQHVAFSAERGWVRVEDHEKAFRMPAAPQKVFNLITSNNRIIAGGHLFADGSEFGGVFIEDMLSIDEAERLEELNVYEAEKAA